MTLCGGGSVSLVPGGRPVPGGDNPACHAACLSRRADEDWQRGDGEGEAPPGG